MSGKELTEARVDDDRRLEDSKDTVFRSVSSSSVSELSNALDLLDYLSMLTTNKFLFNRISHA